MADQSPLGINYGVNLSTLFLPPKGRQGLASDNLKKAPIPDGWRGSGAPRTLLEEDPFTGSPSNGRREYPPALPPLQGTSSHEFIAKCSWEGRQGAKRPLEGKPYKGFPSRSVRRGEPTGLVPQGPGGDSGIDRKSHKRRCLHRPLHLLHFAEICDIFFVKLMDTSRFLVGVV